jgi:hypothetical protein
VPVVPVVADSRSRRHVRCTSRKGSSAAVRRFRDIACLNSGIAAGPRVALSIAHAQQPRLLRHSRR